VRRNIALLLLRRSGIDVDIHSGVVLIKWANGTVFFCVFLCSVFLKKKWKEKKNGKKRSNQTTNQKTCNYRQEKRKKKKIVCESDTKRKHYFSSIVFVLCERRQLASWKGLSVDYKQKQQAKVSPTPTSASTSTSKTYIFLSNGRRPYSSILQ
jgi:hypothetical protein